MAAMTDERQRQQRAKNRALLAVLSGLVLLFYLMALAKLGAF
jgi:hypothetical protein